MKNMRKGCKMITIELEKGLNKILEKLNLNDLSCGIYNQNGTIIGVLFDGDKPLYKDGMILKFLKNQLINVTDLNMEDASILNDLSQKWDVKSEDGDYLFCTLADDIKAEHMKDIIENEPIMHPFLIDYMSEHEDETEFICVAPELDWSIAFDDEFDENTELELGLLVYYLCTNLRVKEAIAPNRVEVELEDFQHKFPLKEDEWWALFNDIEDAVINKNEQECAKIYQTFVNLEEKYPAAFYPSKEIKETKNES